MSVVSNINLYHPFDFLFSFPIVSYSSSLKHLPFLFSSALTLTFYTPSVLFCSSFVHVLFLSFIICVIFLITFSSLSFRSSISLSLARSLSLSLSLFIPVYSPPPFIDLCSLSCSVISLFLFTSPCSLVIPFPCKIRICAFINTKNIYNKPTCVSFEE